MSHNHFSSQAARSFKKMLAVLPSLSVSVTVVPDLKQRLLKSYHRRGGRHTLHTNPVPPTPTTTSSFIHTPAALEMRGVGSCLVNLLLCSVLSEVVSKRPTCWRKVQNLERVKWSNSDSMSNGHLDLFFCSNQKNVMP